MSRALLEQLRSYELGLVTPLLPPASRILEVGAGAGWQAKQLSEAGHFVEAIDLAGSEYEAAQVWPVTRYDGHHIPFPDETFDVVFSSNVLEHIPHVRQFQAELQRVLRPEGIAIHILPSGTWRLWTNATYYVHCALKTRYNSATNSGGGAAERAQATARRPSLSRVLPATHGEFGNALTEIYFFSRHRWKALFVATRWTVLRDMPTAIHYSGYVVAGSRMSVPFRRRVSAVLGSAGRVFVLRKPSASVAPPLVQQSDQGSRTATELRPRTHQ